MSFLAPLWLALGAAVAVPLLLHLLRRNVATRVEFPAARYLQRAEAEHSRSLRIRNLLLMMLRVLIVLALALAAARPFLPGLGVGHGPTAVAVVLDNSLSTTAVVGGKQVFDRLKDAARRLIDAATPADRLWLVTADGRVRGGSRDALLAELARIGPSEGAGDLTRALARAATSARDANLPSRSVAVATDAQRSAWSAAVPVDLPFALFVPSGAPPQNRAVLSAVVDPPRWTPRGTITARVETRDSVDFRILLGDRTLARGATGRDEPIVLRATPPERGWTAGRVELAPDDFPADDARWFALWIGPPPAVVADPSAGSFAATALSTLVADGRATAGNVVRIASADVAANLPALIVPPEPVRLGAANRELERLGIPWRYGAVDRSPAIAHGGRLDAVSASERYTLVRAGVAPSDTLATAGGEPWIVAGPGYVLVASRLDPAATQLPVRAPFVPWLADMLALRLGAPSGDVGTPIAALPGGAVHLPAGSESLESTGGSRRSVTAELMDAPEERGVWFVLRGGRRVGAVVVNAPSEESQLERANPAALAARLGGVRASVATSAGGWVADVFAAGRTRPAATPLLILALLLLAAEALVVRASRPNAA
ncbi:MAG: BatA and WFA domain-containing protein [Gemmatimonadetes bacterium]|nr:BatA and WFA domain-containing protein [Gemmatimonadota bacterium]